MKEMTLQHPNAHQFNMGVDAVQKNKHISINAFHKLNRAKSASILMQCALLNDCINGPSVMLSPHLFSYIHEDVSFVLSELEVMGLCGDFINKNEQAKP